MYCGRMGYRFTARSMENPMREPSISAADAHVFQPAEDHRRLAIFWARAAEAGYAPLLDHMEWQFFH